MKENESDYIENRNQAIANIWFITENYNREERFIEIIELNCEQKNK